MGSGITEIVQVLTDNHAAAGIFAGMIGLVMNHVKSDYVFGQDKLVVKFPMHPLPPSITIMIYMPRNKMDFNVSRVEEGDKISERLIGELNSDLAYVRKRYPGYYCKHHEDDRVRDFKLPEITAVPTPGFFGLKPEMFRFDCSGAMVGEITKPFYETEKELTDEDILKTLTKDQLKALHIREAKARRRDYDTSSIDPILSTFDDNQKKLMSRLTTRAAGTDLSYLKIRKIIYNNPATIVIWKDGTKTVTKVGKDQEFSEYFGLLSAIAKRIYETNGEIDREIQTKREYGNKKEKAVHEALTSAAAEVVSRILGESEK